MLTRPDADDRRGVKVRLTGQGCTVVDAAMGDLLNREQNLLDTIPAAEREHLTTLLRGLLASFERESR